MADKIDPEDLDYELTEQPEEEEALPAPAYEIFSYPADTTLKGYFDQWKNEQLYVPSFQRHYVWDQTRASKLIESFLLGLPVPPVFLYKPASTKSFWIIDGHQRIRSIVDFQSGTTGESKFRLKNVDSRWAGKTIDELTESEKFALETAVLRAIVIQQTNPKDHSSIYHIFERLNTGGVRLNAMEVRQCVYESKFLSQLKDLNELKEWRAIIGLPKADKRLKDIELLLRVIALYRDFENYEKPMKGFLNSCALDFKIQETNNNFTEQEKAVNLTRKKILEVHTALGNKPFHLRGRLNYSALDATFVALMRQPQKNLFLKSRYDKLIRNDEFMDAVSYDTSDESVLTKRISIAISALATNAP